MNKKKDVIAAPVHCFVRRPLEVFSMSLDEQLDALVKLATRRHYWCDDSYYSCPATEEGCSNPAYEDTKECQCGAGEHNAKVASLAEEIKARIKANEKFL